MNATEDLEKVFKKARMNKRNSDPKDYCPNCSVFLCWEEEDGFHAIGSSQCPKPFKCGKKKRDLK